MKIFFINCSLLVVVFVLATGSALPVSPHEPNSDFWLMLELKETPLDPKLYAFLIQAERKPYYQIYTTSRNFLKAPGKEHDTLCQIINGNPEVVYNTQHGPFPQEAFRTLQSLKSEKDLNKMKNHVKSIQQFVVPYLDDMHAEWKQTHKSPSSTH